MRFSFFFIVLALSYANTSANAAEIIAFRGLHQSVRADASPGPESCTAPLVNFENHKLIENTLPSLEMAFQLGADIGHFNIRKTADDQLVSFHDGWLSCRTDGNGWVRDAKLSDLKKLDVGYGYSPKGCDRDKPDPSCFPVRGLGIGSMPTLQEILDRFPDKPFAINDKEGDAKIVALLKQELAKRPSSTVKKLIYVGEAVDLVRKEIPDMQVISTREETVSCLQVLHPPKFDCRNKLFALPLSYARNLEKDLSNIILSLHRQNSRILVFDVNSKPDAEFIKPFNPDLVGTYRIDLTIDALK